MRKSKKIPGRRLSIVPSSCAWVSCWFWIVMLHRSLGVLAATPFQVSIANCQRSDLHQSFPTFEFNFDREKHMQLRIFSACQTSPLWHKTFVMFFCYCLVIFVVDIFVFTFISGFFGATNWRIWCCFEESIAVEERALVQVGVPKGSGTIFADLSPLYIRGISAENSNRPKMVEIQDLYKLISTSLIRQICNPEVCTHFSPVATGEFEERWDILTHEKCRKTHSRMLWRSLEWLSLPCSMLPASLHRRS